MARNRRCVKYEGEQSEWHGGPLTWPGLEYPFFGEYNDPVGEYDYAPYGFFKAKLFNLSVEEDRKHYEWVKDRIINGWFVQYHSETKVIEKDSGDPVVYVYLEWAQVYLVRVPKREVLPDEQSFYKYNSI